MITCQNIYFEYSRKIFAGIGFSAMAGAFIILRGQNGSGKTTLLKVLAGLLPNYQGEIYFKNQKISHLDASFIDNRFAFYAELSALDNLKFWASLSNTELLIDAAIAQFELYEFLEMKYSELSNGQKKRLNLAKLILNSKDIWLLDEPELYLDQSSRERLISLLKIKVSQGGIVIMASHDFLSEIDKYALILNMEDF